MQRCRYCSPHHPFFDQMTDSQISHLLVYIFCMFCYIKPDILFLKTFRQFFKSVRRRNIQAVNRSGVQNNSPGIFAETVLYVILENLDISEKQIFTEAVDYYIFYRTGKMIFIYILRLPIPEMGFAP